MTSGLCGHSSGGVWRPPPQGGRAPFFLQEEVVAPSVLLGGRSLERQRGIRKSPALRAMPLLVSAHTRLHRQGREELVLITPGRSPVLVNARRGFQQTPQRCRRGQDAPQRAVHAASPVLRGLSLFKGVIRSAAGVLHRALVNTEVHPADGMAGEEGRTFVLHVCGQPGGWPVAAGTRGAGLRVRARSRLGTGSTATVGAV